MKLMWPFKRFHFQLIREKADANTNEILAGKGTNWKKISGPLAAEQIREIAL